MTSPKCVTALCTRIMQGLSLLGLLLVLSSVCHAAATTPAPILILGDSLSAGYGIPVERGWVALLQQRLNLLQNPPQVINASISGETSDGGLRRLAALLERHHPGLVVVELGGNDGLRGFPLEVTELNLNQIIEQSHASGAKVLLLGIRIPPNYGARYTEAFHALYPKIAAAQNVPLVPFMLEGVGGHPELTQEDGIHPRAEAQPQILDNIWPYLEPLVAGLTKPQANAAH